jgi:1-acyl-sn-glycerol-3-phosphate acyltransferase
MMIPTAEKNKVTLISRFNICLRIIGTAFIFALVGLCGLLLSFLVFPIHALFSKSKRKGNLRVQKIIHYLFRFVVFLMKVLRLAKLNIIDSDKHRNDKGGTLVISNHPTLIDYVYLVSLFPQLDCVVKQELWNNFFLRGVVQAAGYIKVQDANSFIEEGLERLNDGRTILIFPEGTRSPLNELGSFKKGAASLIMCSPCKVSILTIKCFPPVLMKGQKWFDIPPQMVSMDIQAYGLLQRDLAINGEKNAIKAKANINKYLRNFIKSHL